MINIIEDAIKAQLTVARLPYVRTIATYGGQLDGDFATVIRQLPGLWVVFRGDGPGTPANTMRRVWNVPATFMILVAARNLRNEESQRHGDKLSIGTYQMLADVRALLLQQTFGLPIAPLKPGRTQTLFNVRLQDQAMSAIAQEWLTSYPLEIRSPEYDQELPPEGLTPDGTLPPGQKPGASVPGGTLPPLPPLPPLHHVGLNYHLLPDDGQSDAVDLITLLQGRPKE